MKACSHSEEQDCVRTTPEPEVKPNSRFLSLTEWFLHEMLDSCSPLLRVDNKDKAGGHCGFTRKKLFSEGN